MDAIDILDSDHRKMSRLLADAGKDRESKSRLQLVRQLAAEFAAHAHAEETVIYPLFARYPELEALIANFRDAHRRIKELFAQIGAAAQDPGTLEYLVGQLERTLGAHVREEQAELFPQVKHLMRRPEREQLGRHLAAARTQRAAVAA